MSVPAPQQSRSLSLSTPEGFSRNEGRSLARAQNREISRGLVAATKVQAAGLVAATGLQMTAMLSREAAFQSDGDPVTASRLNFIVDRFAEFAGNEVSRFGF